MNSYSEEPLDPHAGGLNAKDLVAKGQEASKISDWETAAEFFFAASQISKSTFHAVSYVNALLKLGRTDAALQACDTLPGLIEPQAQQRSAELKLRVLLSANDFMAMIDLLGTIRFGDVPLQLLSRLTVEGLKAGPLKSAEVMRKHIAAAGSEEDQLLFEARVADADGRNDDAIGYFECLEKTGDEKYFPFARLQLARIASRSGDRAAASLRWTQVLEQDADHIEALRFFIDDAIQQGEFGRAQELLIKAREQLGVADAILLEARILGDSDRAVALLFEAARSAPDNLDVRIALARVQLRQADLTAALRTLDDCSLIWPDDLRVNKARLKWLEISGAPFDACLKQAQCALEIAPSDEKLLQSVGNLLTRLGRRAEALRHYLTATDIAKSSGSFFWRKAAELLVEESRDEEAKALAQRACDRLGTDTPRSMVNSAEVLFAVRRPQEALDFVETALKMEPGFSPALRLAGEVELAIGRDSNARGYLDALDIKEPAKRRSAVADTMARCMAAQKIPFGDGAKDAPHNLFPERMFHHLAQTSVPDFETPRDGILHIGAGLAAGGAERQLSYALEALGRSDIPSRRPQLALRGIDPTKGNDFYLDDVLATGADLTVIGDLATTGEAREILARRPEYSQVVRCFSAMPAELSDVSIPLLAHLLVARPKIVHLWQDSICASAGLAAMAAGVPSIILSFRSTTPVEVQRSRRYLREGFVACNAYSGVVRMINNSAAGAREYEDWLGLDRGKIGVIHNGYDFDRISARSETADPAKLRAQLGIPNDGLLVGWVARFAKEKRPELWIDTVAEAVKQNDRIYGVMIGEGPKWQQISEMVAERRLGDRIKLLGRKSPVEPWLRTLDLFFLSSLREGLPNVLLEAQSLGVPVATMQAGGSAETLPGPEASILLPDANPKELAQLLLAGVGNAAWRKTAGARASEFVRSRFSLAKTCGALMTLYDEIERDLEARQIR
jgi:glycosyltransferase involved in cell wall biosynthesis/tetratricopeptide (TPR) repeat protein